MNTKWLTPLLMVTFLLLVGIATGFVFAKYLNVATTSQPFNRNFFGRRLATQLNLSKAQESKVNAIYAKTYQQFAKENAPLRSKFYGELAESLNAIRPDLSEEQRELLDGELERLRQFGTFVPRGDYRPHAAK